MKKTKTKITQAKSEEEPDSEHCLSLENEQPVLVESVLDFSDATQPDGIEYQLFEDPIDIPEDSVVETESSDGQLEGHVGHVYEDESDGDHKKDEDYVMDDKSDELDSDDEFNVSLSDVHHEPTKGKGKAIKVSPFFPLFFNYWSLSY